MSKRKITAQMRKIIGKYLLEFSGTYNVISYKTPSGGFVMSHSVAAEPPPFPYTHVAAGNCRAPSPSLAIQAVNVPSKLSS